MSTVVEGFLHSRGFTYRRTVRALKPGTQIGGVHIYQRSDPDGNQIYTATFYGGVMFLGATSCDSGAKVNIDAPCPNPQTEEQVQAAVLNAIEQKRDEIPEGADARTLLDACEKLITA